MCEFNILSCKPISSEIFQNFSEGLSEYKYYYRVCIGRKDLGTDGCFLYPILEVAAFKDSKIADGYIQSLIKKHPSWDEEKLWCDKFMYALPPATCDDHLLVDKIEYLKSLSEQSPK